jgi:hypothetical protein
LLAFLADRHGLDVDPAATVTFTSRGSERWPSGSVVNARPISGHRDMSYTYCPGDVVYRMLAAEIPMRVAALRATATATATGSTGP